jgi:hypothetical protein
MNFDQLTEGIKNPLRKAQLPPAQKLPPVQEWKRDWKNYILNGEIENEVDQKIKDDYLKLKGIFPNRADSWLDQQADKFAVLSRREKTSQYKKIFEHQGIQVFLDGLVDQSFETNAYNMKMLRNSIINMLNEIKDILPNRKPRFVITDESKNFRFKNTYAGDAAGIYRDRLIFIDQYAIDEPSIFVHEYAHYVADLIPTQTEPLLKKSYEELLDSYWRKSKRKKRILQGDPTKADDMKETLKWRKRISEKLGFPQYGLTNFDEFFAVLIENWKKMPNNTATYRFKSLVKNVIQRL